MYTVLALYNQNFRDKIQGLDQDITAQPRVLWGSMVQCGVQYGAVWCRVVRGVSGVVLTKKKKTQHSPFLAAVVHYL